MGRKGLVVGSQSLTGSTNPVAIAPRPAQVVVAIVIPMTWYQAWTLGNVVKDATALWASVGKIIFIS